MQIRFGDQSGSFWRSWRIRRRIRRVLVFVNQKVTSIADNGRGDENKQITRSVELGAAAEERADERNISKDRNGLDVGAAFAFQHAAHDNRFAGLYNDTGR